VIRYFGGTKLGVGGLVRAYGEAAAGALGAAEKKVCYALEVMHIDFPHDRIGAVMHALGSNGAKIRRTDYGVDVQMTLEIRKSKSAELKSLLIERTGGAVRLTEE
jgi:putative IMPACT (imprinted ancient) family translation regulator